MKDINQLVHTIQNLRTQLRYLRYMEVNKKDIISCMKELNDVCHEYNKLYFSVKVTYSGTYREGA